MLIEALDKVRWAVSRTPLVITHGYYRIESGYIYATDGELTAAAPFPDDRCYMVPAAAFDAALRRLPGDGRIELSSNAAKITHGRYRAQVPIITGQGSAPKHPAEDAELFYPSPDFASKLARLQPFIAGKGAQPWAQAVGFSHGCMLATNNAMLCLMTDTGLLESVEVTLPSRAVDYITRRSEVLQALYVTPDKRSMGFAWEDGSWMRAQLLATPFPPTAYSMVEQAAQPEWEIPEDWRGMVRDAASFSGTDEDDCFIVLGRDKLHARNKDAQLELELDTPVPASRDTTKWKALHLRLMLGVATHVDFTQHPKPCPFAGDDCAGIMMGYV